MSFLNGFLKFEWFYKYTLCVHEMQQYIIWILDEEIFIDRKKNATASFINTEGMPIMNDIFSFICAFVRHFLKPYYICPKLWFQIKFDGSSYHGIHYLSSCRRNTLRDELSFEIVLVISHENKFKNLVAKTETALALRPINSCKKCDVTTRDVGIIRV